MIEDVVVGRTVNLSGTYADFEISEPLPMGEMKLE